MAEQTPSKVQTFLLRKFRGLIEGTDPVNIEDAQLESCQNFYPHRGELIPRNGSAPVSGFAYGSAISGLFGYNNSGTWTLIFGHSSGLGKLDGDTMTGITTGSDVGTLSVGTRPWHFKQYKNVIYAINPSDGRLLRNDTFVTRRAGISAPDSAPTIDEGAAGDLEAGDYYAVYTFYNSTTGEESDVSPVSSGLTLGASKKIDWSNLDTSTNPQVDSRRLYRTIKGQEGTYYLVATIGNIESTYDDENVEQADMGAAAPDDNGAPPTGLVAMELFNERMWVTDGTYCYYSQFGLPESYGTFAFLPVNIEDGYDVVGLKSFGDRLIIGKGNAMHYLTGTDDLSFSMRVLTDKHGCHSAKSMAVAEGLMFWFGGDNFYQSDGNGVVAAGDNDVRDTVDSIDPTYYHLVWGEVDPTKSIYICGVPANGDSKVNTVMFYDYRTGDWSKHTYNASFGAPTAITSFNDGNAEVLYISPSAQTGHVFKMDSGNLDGTYEIEYVARTKRYGFGADDRMKFFKEIQVLFHTTQQAEDCTVTIYKEDTVAAQDSLSINTYGGNQWKRIPLANNGNPGTFLSFQIAYTGQPVLKILGMGFKVVNLQRQAPWLS